MIEVMDANPIILEVQDVVSTIDGTTDEETNEGDTFKLVCCDCGLTHRVAVIRNKSTGEMRMLMQRDNRSTGQHRRGNRPLLYESTGKWRLVRNG